MVQATSSHLQRVLQRWVTFWILATKSLDSVDMVVRIATHIAHLDGYAVAHTENAKLRDGILFEELSYEHDSVIDGEQIPSWPEVLLNHSDRQIENEQGVSNDAALERCRVFEQPSN